MGRGEGPEQHLRQPLYSQRTVSLADVRFMVWLSEASLASHVNSLPLSSSPAVSGKCTRGWSRALGTRTRLASLSWSRTSGGWALGERHVTVTLLLMWVWGSVISRMGSGRPARNQDRAAVWPRLLIPPPRGCPPAPPAGRFPRDWTGERVEASWGTGHTWPIQVTTQIPNGVRPRSHGS